MRAIEVRLAVDLPSVPKGQKAPLRLRRDSGHLTADFEELERVEG